MERGSFTDGQGEAAKRAALVDERRKTAARLDALRGDFDAFVEGAELVNTDDEHDPEGATIAFERAQVIALRDDAQRRLVALDGALARLDDGTYGCCIDCGLPIGDERLDAIPEVETCFDCASAFG